MKKLIYRHKKWIMIAGIIIFTLISIVLLRNNHVFGKHSIHNIQNFIKSYGNLSAIAIILLILISTIIPPLPLPIPLLEIVSGIMFGFWEGLAISLIGQVLSSSFAFYLSRVLARNLFRKLLKNTFF